MLENSGYVYLIQAVGTERYKIGRTKDPQRRIEVLGQQTPFPLKLVAILHTNDYVAEEARLHRLAGKYRSHGEWFDLPAWWLEHVDDWFHNPKCHKYVEINSHSKIVGYNKSQGALPEVAVGATRIYFFENSPALPNTQKQIERAICLLGHCSRGTLTRKTQDELTELIGAYPTSQSQAAIWKSKLKQAARRLEGQPQKPHGMVV